MKMIVFVALLAAAGCSKKKSACEVSIGQGIENLMSKAKSSAAPEVQESKMGRLTKAKETLVQRCTTDKWPAEAVSCFATVTKQSDLFACRAKLEKEQRAKLDEDFKDIQMRSMAGRMSPDDNPAAPSGSGGTGAPGGSGAAPAAAAPEGSAAAPAPAGSAAPEPAAGSSAK